MSETFTLDEVLRWLAEEIDDAGGQKAWAERNGVSPQYVCDVLAKRRMPGASILTPIGFEKTVIYLSRRPAPAA